MADTRALEQSEFMAIERPVSRISWGGVFIGAISTIAFGILLFALGAAIGLTAINPLEGGMGGGAGIASGIWSLLSIVVATFFGAWLASRASTVFFKKDATSLGIMTWALSFLAMVLFVFTMASQTTTQLVGAGLEAAGAAAPGAAAQIQPEQQNQLEQQLQQIQPGQVAGAAADVGAAASWWFFLSALLAMFAGILGANAGVPKVARKQMEVRRTQPLRPRETT